MEQVKALSINMPFIEAISQNPTYLHFLKGLLNNWKELEQASDVVLNEQCSKAMMHKLPKKMGDSGSHIVPCEFGNHT